MHGLSPSSTPRSSLAPGQWGGHHFDVSQHIPVRIPQKIAFTAASLALLVTGCVSTSSYTSPGIQPVEESMITKGYYWEKGKDPATFSDNELRRLFDRAESQEQFDGERSELFASQLVWALTAVGDDHFADMLGGYPDATRVKVGLFIDGVWSYHKLNYPATEAVIKPGQGRLQLQTP